MKKLLFILSIVCSYFVNAQNNVSTVPENKNVLLEEFTGQHCHSCPGGHIVAENLLNTNYGNLFVVNYHPTGNPYTLNDPMARTYPVPFYANPFIGPNGRYMPSGMVNRREWDADGRIGDKVSWPSRSATILSEASPVNVGVFSAYDNTSKNLNITVEAYFTSSVSGTHTINVILVESNIISFQDGPLGSPNYVHNHVFREAFTAQWGNTISSPTNTGSLKTFTYTFNNATTNYNMNNCEVIAFVRKASDEEILSVNGAPVNFGTNINTNTTSNSVTVYPNPVNEKTAIHITTTASEKTSYTITNILGQTVYTEQLGVLSAGNYTIAVGNKISLSKGIYFMKVEIGESTIIQKLVVE